MGLDTLSRPVLPNTPWSSGRFSQLLLDHDEYYFGRYQAVALLQLPLGVEENGNGGGAAEVDAGSNAPSVHTHAPPSPPDTWDETNAGGTTPTAEVEGSGGERRRCFKGVLHVCAHGVLFEPRDKTLPVMRLWYKRMTRFTPWEPTAEEGALLEECGAARHAPDSPVLVTHEDVPRERRQSTREWLFGGLGLGGLSLGEGRWGDAGDAGGAGGAGARRERAEWEHLVLEAPSFTATLTRGHAHPPPPPSRTTWTRLVHPSVLTGHVSSTGTRTATRRSTRRHRCCWPCGRSGAPPPSRRVPRPKSLLYTHSVGVRQERRLAPEEKSVAEALSLLMAFAVQGDAAEGARLLADEVVAHEACSLLNPPPTVGRAVGGMVGRGGGGWHAPA